MANFIISFTYTPEAWAAMMRAPADRSEATRAILAPLGGSLECLYFTFGGDDGFAIVDLPDSDAAAAGAIAIAGTGAFRSVTTRELIDPRRMIDVLGKAGQAATVYPTPGGSEDRS